jgi:hypothetical protein
VIVNVCRYLSRLSRVRFLLNPFQYFFFHTVTAPRGPGPPYCRGFTITLKHTTLGWTSLDEWSARRTDLYLTKHDIHNRQVSMLPVGLRDSNPQSQQASGRRSKPCTARPLGSGLSIHTLPIILPIQSAQENKQNFRVQKSSMAKLT